MKYLFSLLLFIVLTGTSFTQNITIYKKSGAIITTDLSKIDSLNFTDSQCPATVTYSGKTYNTVTIGEQCWFKENLNVGEFVSSGTAQTDNSIIEKYCYNNDTNNCNAYGGLYQWKEAMQYSSVNGSNRGICPLGWHIPSLTEYRILAISVNENSNSLKAIGQGSGGGAGTNLSGFSALLGGFFRQNGMFQYMGTNFLPWTSSIIDNQNALELNIENGSSTIHSISYDEFAAGLSVRCVKDN